jgi:Holliday junction resolvase
MFKKPSSYPKSPKKDETIIDTTATSIKPNKTNEGSADAKKRYAEHMKRSKAKGDAYEKQIGEHYERLGYQVIYHGLEKNRRDRGMDLIALKAGEVVLIQCKNWSSSHKYKINHEKLKVFYGEAMLFARSSEHCKGKTLICRYITSEPIVDASGSHFLREHKGAVEHVVIPVN